MKRNTSKYQIKQGNKIVYVGITNDLERRRQEHIRSGKRGKIEQIGIKTTRDAARTWERNRLAIYRRNHGGKNPLYNETDNG